MAKLNKKLKIALTIIGIPALSILLSIAVIYFSIWLLMGWTYINALETIEQEKINRQVQKTVDNNQQIDLCTSLLEGNRIAFPSDQKYGLTTVLGEIFTAYSCGPERFSQLYWGDEYKAGLKLYLNNKATLELLMVLKDLNFSCQSNTPESECREWQLKNIIKTIDLIKLEPFFKEFKYDDCINCG